ncbi:MAG: hypothetical protein NC211_06720 [Alistipes senegalensis]|nr:hypothetical protein [Oxalobacter formigenes]MCM1281503.1 hypothetical protein [Alistipes senegalensis]
MSKKQLSDQEKYNEAFQVRNILGWCSREKNKLALKYALDIRKFEINLYWRRTAYFWTLITLILGSFGFTINQKHAAASVILSCIAFVLCFAWIFVNKGSKHWQENWEYHVDQLENNITGPLYKTVLFKQRNYKGNPLTRPAAMSVSKINLLVCWFMLVVCGSLLVYAWFKFDFADKNNCFDLYACYEKYSVSCFPYFEEACSDFWLCVWFTAISSIACSLIYYFGKSGILDETKLKMTIRRSIIEPED